MAKSKKKNEVTTSTGSVRISLFRFLEIEIKGKSAEHEKAMMRKAFFLAILLKIIKMAGLLLFTYFAMKLLK